MMGTLSSTFDAELGHLPGVVVGGAVVAWPHGRVVSPQADRGVSVPGRVSSSCGARRSVGLRGSGLSLPGASSGLITSSERVHLAVGVGAAGMRAPGPGV